MQTNKRTLFKVGCGAVAASAIAAGVVFEVVQHDKLQAFGTDGKMSTQDYEFMSYVSTYGKNYKTAGEFKQRQALYSDADAKIRAYNAKGYTSKVAHNYLSDLTAAEFKGMKGFNANQKPQTTQTKWFGPQGPQGPPGPGGGGPGGGPDGPDGPGGGGNDPYDPNNNNGGGGTRYPCDDCIISEGQCNNCYEPSNNNGGGGNDPYNPYDPNSNNGGGNDPYNPYDPNSNNGGGNDPYNPYDPNNNNGGGGSNSGGGGSSTATSINWVTKGKVTPIQNQGQCGSCWSFSASGNISSRRAIHYNTSPVDFSEQQLIDCSGSFGNNGCSGGIMDSAFEYVKTAPLETTADYPYKAVAGSCLYSSSQGQGSIGGYTNVVHDSVSAMKAALNEGPVSIAVDASQTAFQSYTSGVVTAECGSSLDHGIMAVGYDVDEETGVEYFLVKNQWGSSWGDNGYIKIGALASNPCGILSEPSFVTFD